MSFIPLALIPQLLFAGALVPVSKMGDALQVISAAAFSRWSFARYSPFKRSFFSVELAEAQLILGGFLIAFLALTLIALRRRT